MKNKLLNQIEKFLSERKKSAGGWAPVSNDEIKQLYNIINLLIEEKYEEDVDGDLPVEVEVINRHLYQRMDFRPVPYRHKIETEDDELCYETSIGINLSNAYRDIDNWLKTRCHKTLKKEREEE